MATTKSFQRCDPASQIKQAGAIPKGSDGNALMCMRPDLFPESQPREATPEHIRKYRQSFRHEPGQRMVHPGLQSDMENLDRNKVQGKETVGSEPNENIVKAQNFNGLAVKFNEIKESKYATHKKEPLGRGLTRDYEWPSSVTGPNFEFGVGSNRCESAKDLLYPQNGANQESHAYALQYQKSHANYEPGKQRTRDYTWSAIGVDPNQHVFGFAEVSNPN